MACNDGCSMCLLMCMCAVLSTAGCMFILCSSTHSVLGTSTDCTRLAPGTETYPDEVLPAWTLITQRAGTDSTDCWVALCVCTGMLHARALCLFNPSQRVPPMDGQAQSVNQVATDVRLARCPCDKCSHGHHPVPKTSLDADCPL